MKQRLILTLLLPVVAMILTGCAAPGTPTATPPAVEAGSVVQLKKAWTLINFGAPW